MRAPAARDRGPPAAYRRTCTHGNRASSSQKTQRTADDPAAMTSQPLGGGSSRWDAVLLMKRAPGRGDNKTKLHQDKDATKVSQNTVDTY